MNPDLTPILARLNALQHVGIRLGLEVMQDLTARLGHPEKKLRFIHVAGTNGKGSTAALLESVLRAAGFRTGLYTSPHLIRFNERIRLNGVPVSDEVIARHFATLEPHLDAMQADAALQPTFFDATTALALQVFCEADAEWVIWETGLGGRLDSTNIVTPQLSLITPIALDHCALLGDTLAAVAAEKAGIIKPGVPVICGPQAPEALAVLEAVAHERRAPLRLCLPGDAHPLDASLAGQSFLWQGVEWHIPLLGLHQIDNAATVLRACAELRRLGVPLHEDVIRQGLSTAFWQGRLQVLRASPLVLLDGAHNPQGATALARFVEGLAGERPVTLVVGLLADKDINGVLAPLLRVAHRACAVPVHNERAASPATVAAACRALAPRAVVEEFGSVSSALAAAQTAEDAVVVIAGSLFLCGEVLELLNAG